MKPSRHAHISRWRRGPLGPWLRKLPRLKHARGTWLHRVLGERFFERELWTPERKRLAAGVATGMFFAMLPVPLQMPLAAAAAWLLRVNIPAAIVCTWLNNPLTAPIFLALQYALGAALLGKAGKPPAPPSEGALAFLSTAPLPILIGSLVLGVFAASLSGLLVLGTWHAAESILLRKNEKN